MNLFLQLINEKKFFLMMVILMVTAMTGIVVWSYLFINKPGIIQEPDSDYDFIIVGGGTAGCVLAARLSNNPQTSVLLIEAGDHFSWLASIPLAAPLLQVTSNDWSYHTKPQIYSSWGLINQSSAWPRGKGLGGSGQLNYMLHSSGNEEDFIQWENEGAQGWGPRDIEYFLSKLVGCEDEEHCTLDCPIPANCLKNSAQCGQNYDHWFLHTHLEAACQEEKHSKIDQRLIRLSKIKAEESPLTKAFLNAEEELRKQGENVVFKSAQSTIYEGQRWSSFDSFLKPVLGRPNLHVMINNNVIKLSVSAGRVRGVYVLPEKKVNARLEVILCAGAVNTPQILLLSGIGPQRQLHKLGIPVTANLPVGLNLHDHLNMPLYVSIRKPVSVTLNKIKRFGQLWDYMMQGEGHLASSAILGVGSTSSQLGIILFGLGSTDEKILRSIANYKLSTFNGLFPFSSNASQEGFVLLSTCLKPLSRGTVTLNPEDPFGSPLIDPKYLSHPYDTNCMVKSVRLADKIVNSDSFRELGAKLHLPKFEECKNYKPNIRDQGYVECIIRTAAITGHHPAGTCKMGNELSNFTVVDPSLRIHGLQGVRIMDASIFPTPVSGHPNSILIAMAEKAAQLILRDYSS